MAPRSSGDLARFFVAVCVAVALATIGLLMPLPGSDRIKNDVADLLHYPSFFALTFGLLYAARRAFAVPFWMTLLIAVAVIGLGAALEWAQSFFGRSSSFQDVMANALGGSAAASIELARHRSLALRRFIHVICLAGLVFVSYMPVRSLIDIYRQRSYPEQVGYFLNRYELHRWYFHAASVRIRQEPDAAIAGNTLQVRFEPDDFPAAQLQHLTRDWTPYRLLRFRIARPRDEMPSENAVAPLSIRVLIRDYRYHPDESSEDDYAYYETKLTLKPGEYQTVEILVGDVQQGSGDFSLFIKNIRFIEFTAVDLKQPAKIELRQIELVK